MAFSGRMYRVKVTWTDGTSNRYICSSIRPQSRCSGSGAVGVNDIIELEMPEGDIIMLSPFNYRSIRASAYRVSDPFNMPLEEPEESRDSFRRYTDEEV